MGIKYSIGKALGYAGRGSVGRDVNLACRKSYLKITKFPGNCFLEAAREQGAERRVGCRVLSGNIEDTSRC